MAICLLALASLVLGSEPDLEFNPATGDVESVDIDEETGQVRHTEDEGQGGHRTVSLVSTGGALNPRLAIRTTTGDSWVVWWVEGSPAEVRYARRDAGDGSWTDEAVISGVGEDSSNPEIVLNGDEVWVAYEIEEGSETSIAAVSIVEDPEPFGRAVVDTTDYTGDLDVMIHADQGHVWVSWADSATDVAWSEYDSASGTWDVTQYASYVGSDVDSIRKAIRDTVVQP